MARTTASERDARRLRALDVRLAGKSYRQVGQELGCSHVAAGRYVHTALERVEAEGVPRLRQLEGARLDALWHGLWSRRDDPVVVDRPLRIVERRSRLFGLDAPVQQHVNTNHSFGFVDVTSDAELARYMW